MTTTPVLGATELVAAQAIPETTENERGRRFEQGAQQFNVLDKDLATPPGSPADGDAYIVAASPTGAWSGKAKNVAYYQTGSGWLFIAPRAGFSAFVADENADYRYVSAAWTIVAAGSLGGATLDTDGTLAANSDAKIPSQKAVKTYVSTAVTGLLDLKGATDCSANPNYPAASKGDFYIVSVAGKIGGGSGTSVDAGDAYFATADNAGGTEASVGTSWSKLEHNGVYGAGATPASTTEQLTGTDTTKVSTPDSVAALWEQGSDVASAGTTSLGEGGYFNITGTTTITDIDFATDKAGRHAWLKFAGILTLTHNASTLILPTGASITTAAGDTACFISEGSDVVRCVAYTRASGSALVDATGGSGSSGPYSLGIGSIGGVGVKGTTAGTPGTGAFTPNAASSGFRAWSALAAGWVGLVRFDEGTDWELSFSYWNGTTLSRASTQLYASSTGSALSLTTAATATLVTGIEELFANHSGRHAGWAPRTSSGTLAEWGVGTAASGGPTQQSTVDNTNALSEQIRVSFTSATTANAGCGINTNGVTAFMSSVAGRGAAISFLRFGFSQIPAGMRINIGLTGSTGYVGATEPSARTTRNVMLGKDSTDTNFQFITNDGTGSGTKHADLGFAPVAGAWYNLAIWNEAGSLDQHMLMVRRDGGSLYYFKATADVPLNNTTLSSEVFCGLSGTTGTAAILHVGSFDNRMGF